MTFVPLICDFVLKDTFGVPITVVRFDSIEALADPEEVDLEIDHMSVEFPEETAAFAITAEDFRSSISGLESFVVRAFDLARRQWPHTIDGNLQIKFDLGGLRVEITGPIELTVVYSEPDGVPTLAFAAADAFEQMRLWSWVTANDSIETLIQINTPGEANPGGL